MKLRYETTRTAIVRGSVRAVLFNRALLWYFAVIYTGVSWLTVRDYLAKGTSIPVLVFALIFQTVFIVIASAIGLAAVTWLGLYLGKGKGVLGEHELTISDAGLTEKTAYNESLHRWSGLGEVRESSAYYFVRTAEGGGAFHLVPKSGHILEGDPHAFVAEIKRRKASGGQPASLPPKLDGSA